jgi:hypothetical protein
VAASTPRPGPAAAAAAAAAAGAAARRLVLRKNVLDLCGTAGCTLVPQSTGQCLQRPLIAFDAWLLWLLALGR